MSNNWLYILLPTISAGSCVYLLSKLYFRSASFEFLSLFVSLSLLNVTQILGHFISAFSFSVAIIFADVYLITLYFLFSQLILFAMALSGRPISLQLRLIVYAFPVTLMLFHFAGLMVEGYRLENGAALHNDGILAWLFDVYILAAVFGTLITLWMNARNNFDHKVIASKNIIALVTFVPLMIVFVALVLASRTSHAVPVVVIVPLVTLYTALSFYYLIRDRVVAISVGMAFFVNRLKLANKLLELKNNKDELKAFTKAIERQFIIEAMEMHGGDIQSTADHLGMNHTTLRNKIKEYEVAAELGRLQAKAI